MKKRQRSKSSSPHGLEVYVTPDGNNVGDHIELHVATSPEHPPPTFDKDTGRDVHVLDSDRIAWMSEMSMETDVATAIAGFIPEIVWHADTRAVPLEMLYDMVLKCFDRSSGRPILKPGLRDRAYLSAKALVHVGIRHRCAGDASQNVAFNSIKNVTGSWDSGTTRGTRTWNQPLVSWIAYSASLDLWSGRTTLHHLTPRLDRSSPPLPCLRSLQERRAGTRLYRGI